MEVIFRPNENLCLLAALWGVANGEQQDLMTNGGEADVKEVFKNSMGKGKDDSLKNGAGADDVRKFLKLVVKVNKARGVKVGFKWRKISGIIGGVVGPFNVESLRTRVLAREDRYVFFGKAKRKSEVHAQLMRSIKGKDEETQLARWGKKATGEMVADHAIGLVVGEGKNMLYDNGFTGGSKDFRIDNMAGRMIDISACFIFDLFELKVDGKL